MKKIIQIALLLLSTFIYAQDWKANFDDVLKSASNENKNILLIFSGSDWCAPCIKLDKNIWQSDAFKNQKDWVLYKADFPKKKANLLSNELMLQNKKLAEKYNKDGNFPLVVVLDKSGKVLGKMGYKNISAEEYLSLLKAMSK
jgi:thioredoxin-related protein